MEKRGAVVLGDKRVTAITDERDGSTAGFGIEHKDGRESGVSLARTTTHTPESLGMTQHLAQQAVYAGLRSMGLSHEEALRRITRKAADAGTTSGRNHSRQRVLRAIEGAGASQPRRSGLQAPPQ